MCVLFRNIQEQRAREQAKERAAAARKQGGAASKAPSKSLPGQSNSPAVDSDIKALQNSLAAAEASKSQYV